MHEIQLFGITFFAALVGVIPPGLVNMSIAKTCVDVRLKAGKQKALGAALVVFIQAYIAIVIAKEIKAMQFEGKKDHENRADSLLLGKADS